MAPSSIHREVAGAGVLKQAAGEAPGREGPVPPQAAPGRGLTRSSGSRPGVRLASGVRLRVSFPIPPVGKSRPGVLASRAASL